MGIVYLRIDTPPGLNPHGCSVLRGGLRHLSPKGLPGPLYILGGVVVSVEARSAVWTGVPADGQALLHHNAAARTRLAGVGRIDRHHSLPGACCLGSEDGEVYPPTSITDAFGEVMVLHHSGDLQVFMIDRVVPLNQLERRFMLKRGALPLHLQMCFGEQLHCLATAVTALLAARHFALCCFEATLRLALAARIVHHHAIGKGGKRL